MLRGKKESSNFEVPRLQVSPLTCKLTTASRRPPQRRDFFCLKINIENYRNPRPGQRRQTPGWLVRCI